MQPSRYPWSPRPNQVDPDTFLQLDPRKMPGTPDFGIGEEQPGQTDPAKAQLSQSAGGTGGGGSIPVGPINPPPPEPQAPPPIGIHGQEHMPIPPRLAPGQEHGIPAPTTTPPITVPTMNSSFGGGGGTPTPTGGTSGGSGGYIPYIPNLTSGFGTGGGGGGGGTKLPTMTGGYTGKLGIGDDDDDDDDDGYDYEGGEAMARGGMVASPRIVKLGERGPEAVMRLGIGERPMRYLRRLS